MPFCRLKTRIPTTLLGVLLLFGVGLQQSHGVTITDNTAEVLSTFFEVLASEIRAAQFTTDANSYTLNFITLLMSTPTSSSGNFQVDIYSDVAGLPGVSLATLTGPANPPLGSVTYNSAGLALAANTSYWVVLSVSSGAGNYAWSATSSFNQVGPGSIGNVVQLSNNAGATWPVGFAFPGQFLVDGTIVAAVPTLSEWGLILLALMLLGTAGWQVREYR